MAQIGGHQCHIGDFQRHVRSRRTLAMPTVACGIAGASFTPSPTMATIVSRRRALTWQ